MHQREKLKAFLLEKGVKQAEFARLINKSRQYVSNILSGKQGFGLEFVLDVAHAFNDIDLNWWLKDNASHNTSDCVAEPVEKYSEQFTCQECANKDKLIIRYERLCEAQENTIKRLESELLNAAQKETG